MSVRWMADNYPIQEYDCIILTGDGRSFIMTDGEYFTGDNRYEGVLFTQNNKPIVTATLDHCIHNDIMTIEFWCITNAAIS